jgi:hypothetical protein
MKKLIILVGVIGVFSAKAAQVTRSSVEDYQTTENYAMFEIKTPAFQKVILDCQGFNMGVYFYQNDKIQTQIHMDEEDCLNFNQFLNASKVGHVPVCLELDAEAKYLEVTDKKAEDCH